MENEIFTYQYSARRNREVEAIRKKYLPKKENKLETLRKLDCRVQSAGMLPSLCVGVVGCLTFGVGMCFGLDVLAGADWLTLFFGAVGTAIMLPAYPVYKYLSKKRERSSPPRSLSCRKRS